MTLREVTSGEKPDYFFAPMPCFDMVKLQLDGMAMKVPSKPGCIFEGRTTIMTHMENLIKLCLMKSEKGEFVYLVTMTYFICIATFVSFICMS